MGNFMIEPTSRRSPRRTADITAQKGTTSLPENVHRSPQAVTIELAMTGQNAAGNPGLTIETVSRTLSPFEPDAIIARPAARRIFPKNHAAPCKLRAQATPLAERRNHTRYPVRPRIDIASAWTFTATIGRRQLY
jgi:hypothetical protein